MTAKYILRDLDNNTKSEFYDKSKAYTEYKHVITNEDTKDHRISLVCIYPVYNKSRIEKQTLDSNYQ
jgi:hypothetical protein